MTANSGKFSTSQFEVDDPVGNDSIERCFLSDLVAEVLVVPERVAELFEKRQHFDRLQFFEGENLVEQFEEGRGGD